MEMDGLSRSGKNLILHRGMSINLASEAWASSAEVRDQTKLPERIQEAMQMQVEAERKKRASNPELLGQRLSEDQHLPRSEAGKIHTEAEKAMLIIRPPAPRRPSSWRRGQGQESLKAVAEALELKRGANAASLCGGELRQGAFGNLAKASNTVLLPTTRDVSGMVTQAMAITRSSTPWRTTGQEEGLASSIWHSCYCL